MYRQRVQQVKLYRSAFHAARSLANDAPTVLFHGDCMDLIRQIPDNSVDVTIASPPYCMGREYDTSRSLADFIAAQSVILPEVVRITKDGGSICWQVGYYVKNGAVYPLDYEVLAILREVDGV